MMLRRNRENAKKEVLTEAKPVEAKVEKSPKKHTKKKAK